jgi:hypothetical protein
VATKKSSKHSKSFIEQHLKEFCETKPLLKDLQPVLKQKLAVKVAPATLSTVIEGEL